MGCTPSALVGEASPLVKGPGCSVDALLERAGGLGAFQIRIGLLAAVVNCFAAMIAMLPTYTKLAAQDEWGLDDLATAKMSAAFFTGQLFFFPFWGNLGDVYGRRRSQLWSAALLLLFSALSFTSNGLLAYCIWRVLVGIVSGGVWIGSTTVPVEFAPPRHRGTMFVAVAGCGWGVGEVVSCVGAWALSPYPWQALFVMLFLVGCGAVAAAYALPETPRYHIQRGDYEAALATLRAVGAENKSPLSPHDSLSSYEARAASKQDGPRFRALRQLAAPGLASRLLLVSGVWFGAAGSYYAVAFADLDWGGNPYGRNLLSISVELPATLLMMPLAEAIGRRRAAPRATARARTRRARARRRTPQRVREGGPRPALTEFGPHLSRRPAARRRPSRYTLVLPFILTAVSLLVVQFSDKAGAVATTFSLFGRGAATITAAFIWMAVSE